MARDARHTIDGGCAADHKALAVVRIAHMTWSTAFRRRDRRGVRHCSQHHEKRCGRGKSEQLTHRCSAYCADKPDEPHKVSVDRRDETAPMRSEQRRSARTAMARRRCWPARLPLLRHWVFRHAAPPIRCRSRLRQIPRPRPRSSAFWVSPDLSPTYGPNILLGQNVVPSAPGAPVAVVAPNLSAFNDPYLLPQNTSPAAPGRGRRRPRTRPTGSDFGQARLPAGALRHVSGWCAQGRAARPDAAGRASGRYGTPATPGGAQG